MNVFLISEDETLAQSIRQIMMRERVYCPLSSMISFDQATRRLAGETADLIVAVLPEDPIRCVEALAMLASLPRSKRTLVIAIGPAADAKMVIRALRGVVDDYLDMGELENELVTVLNGWRLRWSLDRPEGKLIAVLGPSGGSGSSTIAANLAVKATQTFETVGLIDLKLETGDLAVLLDLKPDHSLADLCKNIDRLDQSFFQQTLISHPSGVHLLASPKHLSDIELVTSEGIRQSIGLARATFPFVVIDLDHRFDTEQIQVLRQADLILVVLRLDFSSLKNTTKFLEHLDDLGIPSNKLRIVVNRFGQAKEVPLTKVEEALRSKAFQVLPDDPRAVNRANNNGVPVTLDAPRSRIARGLTKLAQAINTTLSKSDTAARRPDEPESPTRANQALETNRTHTNANYRPNIIGRTAPSKVAGGWEK